MSSAVKFTDQGRGKAGARDARTVAVTQGPAQIDTLLAADNISIYRIFRVSAELLTSAPGDSVRAIGRMIDAFDDVAALALLRGCRAGRADPD
jgi:hypothetical protein